MNNPARSKLSAQLILTSVLVVIFIPGLRSTQAMVGEGQPIRQSYAFPRINTHAQTPACNGCYDYNTTGIVDVHDIMYVANRVGAESGDPEYDTLYDIDCTSGPPDGKIDDSDIRTVERQWREPGCTPGTDLDLNADGALKNENRKHGLADAFRGSGTELPTALAYLAPVSQTITLGQIAAMDIVVSDVETLGAFELDLVWEPSSIWLREIGIMPFLGTTGRSTGTLWFLGDHHSGLISVGEYSYSYWGRDGPSGNGTIIHVEFIGVRAGTSPIEIENILLSTTSTTPEVQPVDWTPGSVSVTVGTPIIINEVDANTRSSDTREFIELYDGGTGNTTLDGLTLALFDGSDDAAYNTFDLDGYTTDSDGYFVIGSVPEADLFVDPGSSGWLQNGADAVALYRKNTEFFDDTPITTLFLIDALVYDTDDADDADLLVLLDAGQPQVDESGSSDADRYSNQRCPNGSGGVRNTESYAQYAPSPDAPNLCARLPEADLELTKTVNPSKLGPGETFTFTLRLTNSADSAADATNVLVADYLPDATTLIEYVGNTCGAVLAGNTLTWTVTSVVTDTSATCEIYADIRASVTITSFVNSAEVSAVDQPDPDSMPGNLGTVPNEDDEANVTVFVELNPLAKHRFFLPLVVRDA